MKNGLLELQFRQSTDSGIICDVLYNATSWANPTTPTSLYDILAAMSIYEPAVYKGNKGDQISRPVVIPTNYLKTIMSGLFAVNNHHSAELLITVKRTYVRVTIVELAPGDAKSLQIHNMKTLEQLILTLKSSVLKVNQAAQPDNVRTCDFCHRGDYLKNFQTIKVSTGESRLACKNCVRTTRCDSCKFDESSAIIRYGIDFDNETGKNKKFILCVKCSASPYLRCKNCGSYFNTKETKICPCKVPMDFKAWIHAHNADVLGYCQKDAYSNELFGIEIEVGTANKNRCSFNEIINHTTQLLGNDAIAKYDSSIDFINKAKGIENDFKGFEIVTRPMVYKNALRFLKELSKNRHPLLRSWEVATCGIHIHVSKACLRRFEIGKILRFINSKYNRNFVKMIAKREDKRFAKFVTKKILDYNNKHPNCHYEAVNTSKKYTIEFRVFRGTLNYVTMASYLQFVESVIEFVRVTSNSDLRYTTYLDFLDSTDSSRFRELKNRIKSETIRRVNEDGEI